MRLNKILIAGMFPVLAMTATSCNSYGTKVTFGEAYEYALKNYDQHILEYVPATYKLKISQLGLKGDMHYLVHSEAYDHPYDHDLSGLETIIQQKNLPGIVIGTEALSKIQYYANYLSGTLPTITGLEFDLSYYLKNGGLTMVLASQGDTINNLGKIIKSVWALMPLIGSYIKGISKLVYYSTVYNISNSSEIDGELKLVAKTDNQGYLTFGSIELHCNYNLGIIINNVEEKETESVTEYEVIGIESCYDMKGSLDLKIEGSATFEQWF